VVVQVKTIYGHIMDLGYAKIPLSELCQTESDYRYNIDESDDVSQSKSEFTGNGEWEVEKSMWIDVYNSTYTTRLGMIVMNAQILDRSPSTVSV
jgi:hypothetical protein